MKKNQEKKLEYQMLVQQINQLQEQFVEVQRQLGELVEMKKTLSDLGEISNERKSLFSIGKGLFVKGKYSGDFNVIVNVGAGICIEKPLEGAKTLIEKQMVEIEGFAMKVQDEINSLIPNVVELQKELQ